MAIQRKSYIQRLVLKSNSKHQTNKQLYRLLLLVLHLTQLYTHTHTFNNMHARTDRTILIYSHHLSKILTMRHYLCQN